MQTSYKATYDLTEIDVRNIEYLVAQTATDATTAVHHALEFCQLSLSYRSQGQCTGILYKRGGGRGTDYPVDHGKVAAAYNARPGNAEPVRLSMNRSTGALQAIHAIKAAIQTQSDSVALSYALEFSATAVRRLRECNGGKYARIFFSHTNSPRQRGTILKSHPYDVTPGANFGRASRKVKSAMGKLNPLRKKPAAAEDQPQQAQTPPAAAAPSEEDAAQAAVAREVDLIQNGTTEAVKTMRPVSFRKPGFNL